MCRHSTARKQERNSRPRAACCTRNPKHPHLLLIAHAVLALICPDAGQVRHSWMTVLGVMHAAGLQRLCCLAGSLLPLSIALACQLDQRAVVVPPFHHILLRRDGLLGGMGGQPTRWRSRGEASCADVAFWLWAAGW